MKWKVSKGNGKEIVYDRCLNQILYDCESAELDSCLPDANMRTGNMRLSLDVGNPDPKEIYFPWDQDDEITEVYYMNNEGKTIERFVY